MIIGTCLSIVQLHDAPAGEKTGENLKGGDPIEASENQAQWLRLTKINGIAVSGERWASAGSSQQYIRWSVVTEPPPAEPPPDDIHVDLDISISGAVVNVVKVNAAEYVKK